MPSTDSKTPPKSKKLEVSFSNWVLGGPLVSVSTKYGVAGGDGKKRVVRKVTVTQVVDPVVIDNDEGSKAVEKEKEKEKVDDKAEKKDDAKKDEAKKEEDKKEEAKKEKDKKDDSTKKSDDNKSSEKKDDGDTPIDGKAWTSEQDTKIKAMKEENKTWKEISIAVGASKKDVQLRFKELSGDGEKKDEGGKEKEKEKEGGDDGGFGDFLGGVFDDSPPDGGEGEKGGKEKGGGGGGGGDGKKGKNNNKQQQQQKGRSPGGNGQNQNQNSAPSPSKDTQNNPTTTASTITLCSCPACIEKTHAAAANNNDDHLIPEPEPELFTGLKPDRIWSKEDCEVLEELERRYRENKWLQLQAEFFNWTGRMVEGGLIERKFRDDGLS